MANLVMDEKGSCIADYASRTHVSGQTAGVLVFPYVLIFQSTVLLLLIYRGVKLINRGNKI